MWQQILKLVIRGGGGGGRSENERILLAYDEQVEEVTN